MKKITLLAFACVGLAGSANAATLFELVVSTNDSTAVNVDASISGVTGYTRGSGLGVNAGGTFNSNGFNFASKNDAIGGEDFITWGFTSGAGVDLTDFSVRYDRSGSGPTKGSIDFRANGGSWVEVLADDAIDSGSENNLNIDMSAFDGVTSGEFRFTGWAASGNGTFDFENTSAINDASFQLTGEPVPEPATLAVLAAAGLMAARRRKKA